MPKARLVAGSRLRPAERCSVAEAEAGSEDAREAKALVSDFRAVQDQEPSAVKLRGGRKRGSVGLRPGCRGGSAVCGRPGARPAPVSIAVARGADERAHELDRLVVVESLFVG